MQEQTQQQLLSELEKRKKAIQDKFRTDEFKAFHNASEIAIFELDFCIQLIKSITTNRSSQEPKIKE